MRFNKLIRTLFLVGSLILPLISFGDDVAQTLFAKGNDQYAKAQYKDALSTYQQVVNDGYQSAALYFNMGNASYKMDDIPSALLYYEKAHKLSPGDDDISFNIRFANQKVVDKIDEAPEFFLANWWKSFILGLSTNALAIISIILALFGSASLIVYFYAEIVSIKKSFFYAAVAFFFLGLFSVFIAGMQLSYFDNHQQAIIFSGAVTVKSGPADKSATLFVLHDGTKVNVLDKSNGWIKIRLTNNNEGWIKPADVKEI